MKNTKLGDLGNLDFNPEINFDLGGGGFSYPDDFPKEDPFANINYTGDPEKDSKAELDEYQKEARDHMRNYQKMIDGVFNSRFWFAVVFENESAKLEFLKEFNFLQLGDQYIDGGKLAKALRKLIPASSKHY